MATATLIIQLHLKLQRAAHLQLESCFYFYDSTDSVVHLFDTPFAPSQYVSRARESSIRLAQLGSELHFTPPVSKVIACWE